MVNRLRQVTSAIKQDGANQVSIITSTAERKAAVEFAKAAAIRPQLVGEALQEDQPGSRNGRCHVYDPGNAESAERRRPNYARPKNGGLLTPLLAAKGSPPLA